MRIQNNGQKSRTGNNLLLAMLFSVIGGFVYVLTTNYRELVEQAPDTIVSVEAALITIGVFNILGFSIVQINNYLARRSPLFFGQSGRMGWNFLLIALILLLLHYALLVLNKWVAGAEPLFSLSKGGLKVILTAWFIEILIVGLLLVLHSSRHMLNLYRERELLKEEATKARYRALQSQLNPHFLFNSLNTLISEIQYDPANAVLFTQNLSDVYRYVLQQEDKNLVPLENELAFLDAYIFLYRVRLGDCLRVERQLPREALNAKLPPLTLQLLAENVIKHNYIDDMHRVTISLTVGPDARTLFVSNGLYPKQDVLPSGKGLRNLAERYRLLCDEKIEVLKSEDRFTVSIPLIHEQ